MNINGVLDLIARAADYRLGSTDPRTLSIFPLPSRIENAELELSQTWQKRYQRDFESALKAIYNWTPAISKSTSTTCNCRTSFYSYGEEIAFAEGGAQRRAFAESGLRSVLQPIARTGLRLGSKIPRPSLR